MTSSSADNDPGRGADRAPRPSLSPDPRPRGYFQLALAAIIVPVLAFVVSIALAIRVRAAARVDPGQRVWARRFTALAVVDVLVFVAMIALLTGKAAWPAPPVTTSPGPRIGLELAPEHAGPGARVLVARPGSPADRAGIKAGDVIETVDDQPVDDREALSPIIAATKPGQERVLGTLRDGERLRIHVVPELTPARPERRPLFLRDGPAEPIGRGVASLAAAWGGVTVLLGIVCFVARRRHPPAPSPWAFWLTFVGLLGASDVVLVGVTAATSWILGGSSLGGALLGLVAASATLLILAVIWRHRLGWTDEPARAPTAPTVVAGVAYMIAGAARVGILLAGLGPLLRISRPDPGREIEDLLGSGPGPAGVALLIFAAVVLAPIGEETLFRGVLLPWLSRWVRPDTAVWLSAILFGVGHLRYGVAASTIVVYGLVLGWARLTTGNLRASMILHMIINAVATGVALSRL